MRYLSHGSLAAVALGATLLIADRTGVAATSRPADAASVPLTTWVDPLIGSRNRGNTFPGATLPFGMLQWSPENTTGEHNRTPLAMSRYPTPGGYQYDATRIRGFSLTHMSGTGCFGASGDIPFMPVTLPVTTSPALDATDARYASDFSHAREHAAAGAYSVELANGVTVDLAAALRSGIGRFEFPAGKPANLLVRASDSEVGSSAASVDIDKASRTIAGSVTSGSFCGYTKPNQRSYYTLYFIAQFDQPFAATGTWHDAQVDAGGLKVRGGTGFGGPNGFPLGKGSGAWVAFDTAHGANVVARVGISYVSLANARANLAAEIPPGTTLAQVRSRAQGAWNDALGRITVSGGTPDQLTTFYTALYHALSSPNTFSDVNGEYRGFDQKIHRVEGAQKIQYANFSLWDVYRSELQLLTWLMPERASDFAQSLYNQAQQNGGVWDRWTHESGGVHVMTGDPSAPALADIVAFGGRGFDLRGAYASLKKAATVPTPGDLEDPNCNDGNIGCVGQRPSLDLWMKLHYIPTKSRAWGGAGETLEDATADFALSQLADTVGDRAGHELFLTRAGYWHNLFNPHATPDGGYIQNRNADGSWPAFTPDTGDGFVEGTASVYLWMVPFDARGLFDSLGGDATAVRRLDAFFHRPNGTWALTNTGPLHSEMDNEPSLEVPWLYNYAGAPWKTQETVHAVLTRLWRDTPDGIPGEDDLGEMSSWYVWAALGLYPEIPGRAELLIGSPLFPHAVVHRPGGDVTIDAPGADCSTFYVQALTVDGKPWAKPWLPAAFAEHGGKLEFKLGARPNRQWGAAPADAPPSFPPPAANAAKTGSRP